MILLREGSGSIGNKVETVDIKNDELNVKIKRTVPEGGTCDMAYWYIFIPIKKDYFNGDIVNVGIVSTPNDPVKEPPVVPPVPYTYTGAGYAFNNRFLDAFPWEKYGDYKPLIFYGDTNIILVSSKTEIRELFGETYNFYYDYYEKDGVLVKEKDTYFQDVVSKYNDDYFENHQLLTFFLGAGGSANRHELESVVYTDGVLTVTFDYLNAAGPCVIEYWFAIVEIYRIPADTRIDIVVNNNGKLVPADFIYYPHRYMLTGENPPVMVPPVVVQPIGDPSVVRPIHSASRYYNDVLPLSEGWIAVGKLHGLPLDAIIAKYDSLGNIIWEKAFGGLDSDEFKSVIEISDGYIISAISASVDGNLSGLKQGTRGKRTPVTVKYDKDGTLLWAKELNIYYSAVIANDSGFLAVRGEKKLNNANSSVRITQFDTNGNVLWEKPVSLELYEGNNYLSVTKIFNGPDGYFLLGQANYVYESFGDSGGGPVFMASVSTDGIVRWQKQFPGERGGIGGILIASDGIIVTGRISAEGAIIEKFDFEMNSVWNFAYPLTNLKTDWRTFGELIEIGGNIFVTGSCSCYGDGGYHKVKPFIFGINANGELIWDTGLKGAEGIEYTYYCRIFKRDEGFVVYQYAYNTGNYRDDISSLFVDNSFIFFDAPDNKVAY
jgi:hypothetical protein